MKFSYDIEQAFFSFGEKLYFPYLEAARSKILSLYCNERSSPAKRLHYGFSYNPRSDHIQEKVVCN